MLKGKTAFITGTNRGIGKAILEEFAKNGANIVAHARQETSEFTQIISEFSQKYGVDIMPIYFDLSDKEAMKLAIKGLYSKKIPINILVNNAGVTHNTLFQMTSEKILRDEFDINVFSVYLLTQYLLKIMLNNTPCSIINMSSISGLRGDVGRSVYGMTKAAIHSLTQSLAVELGAKGIRVNSIAPGFIQTDMMNLMSRDIIENNIQKSALKRIGKVEDVAQTAVFLASDKSSYITGQIIRVDGGM